MSSIDRAELTHRAVESNAADLLAYFGRRVGCREDAADLLGDTLVVIWRRSADLPRDPTRARMWMFGVARRVLANHLRGQSRRNALADKLRRALVVESTDTTWVSDHNDVWSAVDALPAPQREIVLLVHGDGFTVTEAARLMKSSASTARTRYSTALLGLRRALGEPQRDVPSDPLSEPRNQVARPARSG